VVKPHCSKGAIYALASTSGAAGTAINSRTPPCPKVDAYGGICHEADHKVASAGRNLHK